MPVVVLFGQNKSHVLIFFFSGKPIGIDLTGHFLTVFSLNGFIKIYDISRHEPKLVTSPRAAYDLFEHFGEIIMAKTNTTGSHVLIIIANENLIPVGKLYIWNIETDKVLSYDFMENLEEPRLPLDFYWDSVDNRLFACETKIISRRKTEKLDDKNGTKKEAASIHVMLVLDSSEIGQLESFELAPVEKFINFSTPHIVRL